MKMRMEYQETAVPLCSHRKIVCFVQQSRSGLAQLTANAAALAMLMLCCNATPSSGSVPDTKAIICVESYCSTRCKCEHSEWTGA